MARRRRNLIQRDFSLLQIGGDFLERDDLDIRNRSLQAASNVEATVSGSVQQRPGTLFVDELPSGSALWQEIRLRGRRMICATDTTLYVIQFDGTVEFSTTSVHWTTTDGLWVADFSDQVVIGHPTTGMQVLSYSGSWSLDNWGFAERTNGETAEPFWAFERDNSILIEPSAYSGSVTLTATDDVFEAGHVGATFRYMGVWPIKITGYTSPTEVSGDIIGTIAKSYRPEMADASVFSAYQVVLVEETGFEGICGFPVVSIIDSLPIIPLNGVPLEVGDVLIGPGGSQTITTSVNELATPYGTPFWDESLMSDARGWPGSACAASGRMIFCNFPELPDVIVGSSSRAINDVEIGVRDDDGFARTEGDGKPRFLHAVNAGDLILFSDRGLYAVPLRDNVALSPTTFNAKLFDHRAAADVKPAVIGSGVIFVEAGSKKIGYAYLDGNVYLKWNVQTLNDLYSEVITEPVHICTPPPDLEDDQKYVIITNADGSAGAMRFFGSLTDPTTGFAPWTTTAGDSIQAVIPIWGKYYPVVSRQISGGSVLYLERLYDEVFMDCVKTSGVSLEPDLAYLAGKTVSFYDNGYDRGDYVVSSGGTVVDQPDMSDGGQVGLNYTSIVRPWPRIVTDSEREGRFAPRTFMFYASVRGSSAFEMQANDRSRVLGGYSFGDDLSEPPPLTTSLYRVPVFSKRNHPQLIVRKHRPGPFSVLYIGQEVQY